MLSVQLLTLLDSHIVGKTRKESLNVYEGVQSGCRDHMQAFRLGSACDTLYSVL